MNNQLKKTIFVFGFIGFTAGILWSVNIDYDDQIADDQTKGTAIAQLTESGEQEKETTDKPFWSQLMPRTSIEKRDEARSSRQREIASMINSLRGVTNTTVVLSDNEVTGIGSPRRPMTACVSVEPTDGILPETTIQAIQKLVASATTGLSIGQVTVIDNLTGAECSAISVTSIPRVKTELLQKRVTAAIALNTANVTVTMERPVSKEVAIPWHDNERPFIQVAVPASWVIKKSNQVGGKEALLDTIRAKIARIAPDSKTVFQIVQDQPVVLSQESNQKSYAQHIAVIVGLLALLLSGFIADRRRRPRETVVFKQVEHPYEEARQILAMNFDIAKKTIDSLKGPRKFKVLQAIVEVESEIEREETPVVQVQKPKQVKKKQTNLMKCS